VIKRVAISAVSLLVITGCDYDGGRIDYVLGNRRAEYVEMTPPSRQPAATGCCHGATDVKPEPRRLS
ncbi:hypothetical protein, partial [Mycobacterium avium]